MTDDGSGGKGDDNPSLNASLLGSTEECFLGCVNSALRLLSGVSLDVTTSEPGHHYFWPSLVLLLLCYSLQASFCGPFTRSDARLARLVGRGRGRSLGVHAYRQFLRRVRVRGSERVLERVSLDLRPCRLTGNSGSAGFTHPNRWDRFHDTNCGRVE